MGRNPELSDCILSTDLGVAATEVLAKGHYCVTVAVNGGKMVPVPLEKVAGKRKLVSLDYLMIQTACLIGLCFGD